MPAIPTRIVRRAGPENVRLAVLSHRAFSGRGRRPAPLGPAGLSRQGVCSLFSLPLVHFCLASRLQAAQAALFGPGCLRVACAVAGVCTGPSAQPWSLAGRQAAGSFRTDGSLSSRCAVATASQHSCHRHRRCNGKPAQLPLDQITTPTDILPGEVSPRIS